MNTLQQGSQGNVVFSILVSGTGGHRGGDIHAGWVRAPCLPHLDIFAWSIFQRCDIHQSMGSQCPHWGWQHLPYQLLKNQEWQQRIPLFTGNAGWNIYWWIQTWNYFKIFWGKERGRDKILAKFWRKARVHYVIGPTLVYVETVP